MHAEVVDFIQRIKAAYPSVFRGRILECGSLDINGSPRSLFHSKEYVGLDWRRGPGVDEVGLVHEYHGRPNGYFDTVISTEMLEHDPHWSRSLRRMVELLRDDGSLIVTCAGPGRPPHEVETSPQSSYYKNLSISQVRTAVLGTARFKFVHDEYQRPICDTRLAVIYKLPHSS